MAHHVSKRSARAWMLLGVIGLPVLIVLYLLFGKTPGRTIRKVLSTYGLSPLEINYWIAVSAFETTAWTSQVYRDSNNLFNLIVPGSQRLSYGEGQTIFASPEDSVIALWTEVIKPFKYSLSHPSLRSLTDQMANKGFYRSDSNIYYQGTLHYLQQFYPGKT